MLVSCRGAASATAQGHQRRGCSATHCQTAQPLCAPAPPPRPAPPRPTHHMQATVCRQAAELRSGSASQQEVQEAPPSQRLQWRSSCRRMSSLSELLAALQVLGASEGHWLQGASSFL